MDYSAFHWSEKARKYAETIGTIFNVKGRVNAVQDLPSTGNKVGDLWLVGLTTDPDLIEYAWLSFDNITRWEKLGSTATSLAFSAITGSPNDNVALKNALDGKYSVSNPDGYISGITSSMVTTALGYTPYNSSNPSGYISGITSAMVTTALGYTPQQQLVSGTNIKTVNSQSLLGSGNIEIQSAPDVDNKSISLNASDELQTIGVINQNNTTTALKQWSGTKAQYDAIATKDANTIYNITDDTTPSNFANTSLSNLDATGQAILSSKVDLVSGVSQSDVDYVVASQLPTSENNYTWKRLYKSGWVEQGGIFTKTSNPTSVSLPIEMEDTNYSVLITPTNDADSLFEWTGYCSARTTTSFSIVAGSYNSSGSNTVRHVCLWEVKGMSEQGDS